MNEISNLEPIESQIYVAKNSTFIGFRFLQHIKGNKNDLASLGATLRVLRLPLLF